jgi:PAS domain S-box-containing protein
VAAAAVLAAWLIQSVVGAEFGRIFAFIPFLIGGLLAGLLGGLGPAIFALSAGYVLVAYFYLSPGSLIVSGKDSWVGVGMYVLVGIAVALLTEAQVWAQRRAEAAFARLEAVFASMGDAVVVVDSSGRVASLNPAAERLTGWTCDEAVGQPTGQVLCLAYEQTGEAADDRLAQLVGADHRFGPREPIVLQTRDGQRTPVEETAAPVRDSACQSVGVVIALRDCTRERQAQAARQASERAATERLNLLDHVYRTAPVGMGLVDGDLRYVRMNDVLASIDGRSADDCVGHTIREFVPELADSLEPLYRGVLDTGEPLVNHEVRGFAAGAPDERTWLVSYYPVQNGSGQRTGVSSVVLDITDRKRSEDALREADRRKNEFLAMLAHELRNPLATIRYAVDLWRLEATGDQRDTPEVIDHQLRHLARLVDDLLDISRINRGKIRLQRQPRDAGALIAKAVDTARLVFDRRRQAIEVLLPEKPTIVDVDPTRFEQILQNLLLNASKYSEAGSLTTVALTADNGEAVISIRDQGIGIAADLLLLVFDPFVQAERSLDRAQGGLGIGLTLVRQIVALHGGSVTAESPGPGQGSTFIVRLPLASGSVSAVADEAASQDLNETPLRILIVEDNAATARALQSLLQLIGHSTAHCDSGTGVVAAARAFGPQLVLLDMALPGRDGASVARDLRQDPDFRGLRIVGLSGFGEPAADVRQDFDRWLVKPVDYPTLRRALREATAALARPTASG